MKIAYLMNQHPYLSCTFIRREMEGLESLGLEVFRYSIRAPEIEPVDEADRREIVSTRYILGSGAVGLVVALVRTAMTKPIRFIRAAMFAIQTGYRSDRGMLIHLAYLAEACVLVKWCSQASIQHVHAHFATNSTSVAMLCQALGGPRYSFTVHGPHEFDRPDAIALTEKINRAEFVVAVSSFTKSQILRWCAYRQWQKVHVVRCGLDQSYLGAEPTAVPASNRLVCVGRLCEQKGQLLLVQAATHIAAEGLAMELLLIGDGELRESIESLIREHSLEHVVKIVGWQSGEQVRRHIMDSRSLVLSSFAEGLPVVIMESFALARPVIATYVSGIPELVSPGHNGWLVPAGSVDDLAEAMRQALKAPCDQLFKMGLNGRERVLQFHNAATEAKSLAELFAVTDCAEQLIDGVRSGGCG